MVSQAQAALRQLQALERVPVFVLTATWSAPPPPPGAPSGPAPGAAPQGGGGGVLFPGGVTRAHVAGAPLLLWVSEDSAKPVRMPEGGSLQGAPWCQQGASKAQRPCCRSWLLQGRQGATPEHVATTLVVLARATPELLGADPGAGQPLPPQTAAYQAERTQRVWEAVLPDLARARGERAALRACLVSGGRPLDALASMATERSIARVCVRCVLQAACRCLRRSTWRSIGGAAPPPTRRWGSPACPSRQTMRQQLPRALRLRGTFAWAPAWRTVS